MFDISDKVAIVTGGRRGIGRAFVDTLSKVGVKVFVIAKSIDSAGLPDAQYLTCDLSKKEQREGIIKEIINDCGHIDILVNNAGFQYYEPSDIYSLDILDKSISVMVSAALDLSQQVFPHMKKQQWGRIVNISSLAGFQGTRNTIGYTISKHAIDGLTKCLSNEWSPFGITVNSIAPGYINTTMLDQLINDPERAKDMMNRIPVGRFGTPDDLVGALIFLCSNEASYITGQSIIIDGGWRSRG